jgi:SSS family solute:Na+ symporter
MEVAYTLLSGSLFCPVFAGFFWKRANAFGTIISMFLSATVAVAAMMVWGIGSTQPIMFGVATSLVTLVVVSLLTAPPDPERVSEWQRRMEGATEDQDSR